MTTWERWMREADRWKGANHHVYETEYVLHFHGDCVETNLLIAGFKFNIKYVSLSERKPAAADECDMLEAFRLPLLKREPRSSTLLGRWTNITELHASPRYMIRSADPERPAFIEEILVRLSPFVLLSKSTENIHSDVGLGISRAVAL